MQSPFITDISDVVQAVTPERGVPNNPALASVHSKVNPQLSVQSVFGGSETYSPVQLHYGNIGTQQGSETLQSAAAHYYGSSVPTSDGKSIAMADTIPDADTLKLLALRQRREFILDRNRRAASVYDQVKIIINTAAENRGNPAFESFYSSQAVSELSAAIICASRNAEEDEVLDSIIADASNDPQDIRFDDAPYVLMALHVTGKSMDEFRSHMHLNDDLEATYPAFLTDLKVPIVAEKAFVAGAVVYDYRLFVSNQIAHTGFEYPHTGQLKDMMALNVSKTVTVDPESYEYD
jgi:hypothetical protein